MEPLAALLQQAQAAVLSVQEDVATMRAQLDEGGDDAIVNPCVVDLQVTIQQKQEASAELLRRAARLFYELMGEVDEKARALGNVKSREQELEKTKKAMQRYFDAQRKTQDQLKDEYDSLLSVQEQKLAHLTDAAAGVIQSHTARHLQHRALTLWLKKAMIRSFWRLHQQQEEVRHSQQVSFTQDQDALAHDFHAAKSRQMLRQKVFYTWERRVHHRVSRRLRAEVQQLEKEADFFRTECATTQRALSGRLQDEHNRMQLATHAKSRECELLDDEVGRLKHALVELTGEFSERTQTYVRQQAETELFFQRKEQKLREALEETQKELEKLRAYTKRFHSDMHTLGSSTTAYVASAADRLWEASTQKSALFAHSALLLFGRLAQRHARAQAEVAELLDNVDLLAPLSEKILHVESELAAVRQSAEVHKRAAQQTGRRADQLGHVASLLTDHLERAGHHRLRSFYFMCWATHATAKRRRALESAHAELQSTLRTRQREFLVQLQGQAANSREERERLLAELEDQRIATRSLQKEVAELKDQGERKEGLNFEAQMDINKLRAQLARSEQERESLLAKLAAAKEENLRLDEDNRRYSLEKKEAVWRLGLQQQHVDAWRAQAESLEEGTAMLTQVCEQWSQHCDTAASAHKKSVRGQNTRSARALSEASQAGRRAAAFSQWLLWARHKRILRETNSHHTTQLRQVSETLEAERRRYQRDTKEKLAAVQSQHEEALARLAESHAVESAAMERVYEAAVAELRGKHAESTSASSAAHVRKCQALMDELAAIRRAHEEDLAALAAAHTDEKSERTALHERALHRLREEHAREKAELSARHERQLTSLTADMAAQREQHEAEVAALTAKHAMEVISCAHQHEQEVRHLRGTHASYIASVAQEHSQRQHTLTEELADAQRRLGEVGELVVVYCAQAALAKWLAYTRARRAGRDARRVEEQMLQYRRAAQTWMTSRAELITQRYQRGDELLLGAIASCHTEVVGRHDDAYRDLADRNRQLAAQLEGMTDAGEAMELQVRTLSADAKRVRVQLDAERSYAAAMKAKLADFASHHDTQRLLYGRVIRHLQRVGNVAEDHLQSAMLYYEESCSVAHEAHLARQQAASRAVAVTARPPASTVDVSSVGSEGGPASSRSDTAAPPAHVALGEQAVGHGEALSSRALALPGEVGDRLIALERASHSYVQSQHTDAASLERIRRALVEPFTVLDTEVDSPAAATVPTSMPPPPSVLPCVQHGPAPALYSLEAALEVVRRSALCLVADSERQRREEAAASAAKLKGAEASLADVRHAMDALLSEQRCIAAEMRSQGSQSRSTVVSPPSACSLSPQGPLGVVEATPQTLLPRSTADEHLSEDVQPSPYPIDVWTERLDMLTSRYQRVLDAFANKLDERRTTFYSTNGMLVAAEMFSAELLARYEANMTEMRAIKEAMSGGPTPAARQMRSQATSPMDPAVALASEQERSDALAQLQEKLGNAAGAYEAVLREFLASVREGQGSFQLSARALQAADSFGDRLIGRVRETLGELSSAREAAALEPYLTSPASDTQTGRSLAGDFICAAEGDKAGQGLSNPKPSSSAPSATAQAAREDSPEKIILRDRVELLERLLVQAKVQLAEARQLLATSGAITSLPPLREAESSESGAAAGDHVSEDARSVREREREREVRRLQEEQLVRVRADTEQLVVLRYKEEMQRREDKIATLLTTIEDNSRFHESEKAQLARRIDHLTVQLSEAEAQHTRTVEQLQRRFRRELDELAEEVAAGQEALHAAEAATAAAVARALDHQRGLLAAETDEEVGRLRAELRRVGGERDQLQHQKAASENQLQRMADEAHWALETAVRRHREELSELGNRYESALEAAREQQQQLHAHTGLVDGMDLHTMTHADRLHDMYDAALKGKTAYLLAVMTDACRQSIGYTEPPVLPGESPIADPLRESEHLLIEALQMKCDLHVSSTLACVEAYYADLLTQAMTTLECEKDELETENMQLREQVALIKAASRDPSAEEGVHDLTGGCPSADSPSVRQSHSYSDPSPLERQGDGTPVVVRGLPARRAQTGSDSYASSPADGSGARVVSPHAEEPAPLPSEPSPVTPPRGTRDRSLDSLELSQRMLRYSRMLDEQGERNAARLHQADALSAQVDDLIAQGERLSAWAVREHLTPLRHRSYAAL